MIVKAPILAWLFFVLGAGALQPPARASFRRHQDFANSRARSGGPCLTRLSGSEDSNQDGNYDPRFGFGSLGFVLLDALQRGAGRDQVRPGEVAIAWLLHNPCVTAPVVDPRTLEQLESAVRAAAITLDIEALKTLDTIFPGPGGEAPKAYAW